MLFHTFVRFFRLFVMGDIGSGRVNSAVQEVNPNSCFRFLQRVFGQQRILWKFFFQIFINDCRLINDAIIVDENRDLGVRVEFEQFSGLIFKIDFQEFVRDFLFGEDNPCPVSIRSGMR
jgi:hypothetical protein